jgi:4-hydroxybenzoate polyprenyltransferase
MLCLVGGLDYDPMTSLILFLITFAAYAADKVSGSKEDLLNNPRRAVLAKYHVKLLAWASYGIALVITAFWWDKSMLPYVIVPGVAELIYTARIKGVRPKDLFGMKTLIVASSTAFCRAGLVGGAAWLYVLVFLMMVIDTVLFDIRDVKGDASEGVMTLPVVLGRYPTLAILAISDIILFMLSPIVAILGAFFIFYYRKDRHSLSYDLLVDAWALWVTGILILLQWPPLLL